MEIFLIDVLLLALLWGFIWPHWVIALVLTLVYVMTT